MTPTVEAPPIFAVYRNTGGVVGRAALKPLHAALRSIAPTQARAQRALSQRDRNYTLEAEVGAGWRLGLVFEGEVLTLALRPPQAPEPDPTTNTQTEAAA